MAPIEAPWDFSVVASDYRAVLDGLEGGRAVPNSFVSNANTFVPDDYSKLHPSFANTTAAGIIHDWDYFVGGGWRAFFAANARYRRNLRRLGLNPVMTAVRFTGVSFAVLHFNWR